MEAQHQPRGKYIKSAEWHEHTCEYVFTAARTTVERERWGCHEERDVAGDTYLVYRKLGAGC